MDLVASSAPRLFEFSWWVYIGVYCVEILGLSLRRPIPEMVRDKLCIFPPKILDFKLLTYCAVRCDILWVGCNEAQQVGTTLSELKLPL
jgi:hypothetical protein